MGWPPRNWQRRKLLARHIDDLALGAARVGDQRIGPHQRVEMAHGIQNPADGRREEDQVRLPGHASASGAAVDGAGFQGAVAARGELTPRISPSKPALRSARPNEAPINPVPTMATVFRWSSPPPAR
jgi:hypothetical protein